MDPAHLGLIFSTLAGITTTVGSLTVYCLRDFDPSIFAFCMAVSAGVMIYVSFIELYPTSLEHLTKGFSAMNKDDPEKWAYVCFTITFFIGWALSCILNSVMECFFVTDHNIDPKLYETSQKDKSTELSLLEVNSHPPHHIVVPTSETQSTTQENISHLHKTMKLQDPLVSSDAPFTDMKHQNLLVHTSNSSSLEFAPHLCIDDIQQPFQTNNLQKETKTYCPATIDSTQKQGCGFYRICTWMQSLYVRCYGELTPDQQNQLKQAQIQFVNDQKRIMKLGCFTAVVLAIHNFPEGVATYTGFLANPRFGIDIAIAFALHNIPEGFSIAVPIYYGTGNKFKGFFYSFLSGMTEPLGAFVVHFITGGKILDLYLGGIVGCVCGIMTSVSLNELYPQALRYDVLNRFSTIFLVLSMFTVAITLIVLKLANL